MADMEALMARTIELVQPLIKKPKLTPKLPGKPPFRFLHDVISQITASTGFADGLYEGDELNAGTIKALEKQTPNPPRLSPCPFR